jgi:uncharacterized protein YycO
LRLKHALISFCILFAVIYFIYGEFVVRDGYHTPSHTQIDITSILNKTVLYETDYKTLYEQTGIAKPIVEELKELPDFEEKMLRFQKDYLTAVRFDSENLSIVTLLDSVTDESGKAIAGFELAPYHNGYIFLTKSTRTMNWRHGHAGVVIDEKRGKLLEALNPGTISMEQDAVKWRYFPTFKMMRLKDTDQTVLDEIASYASSSLRDLPYNILADKNQGLTPSSTHCSLLVWQTFNAFGFDLDEPDTLFVSPQNIAASPLLETLQIFGFNPDKDW